MRKSEIIIFGIIIITFAIGIYYYPQMPEKLASHWNAQGQVDGYTSKLWGLFLMPIISVGMLLLFILIPRIDPLKSNIQADPNPTSMNPKQSKYQQKHDFIFNSS